jgi:acylphosphatase
VQGVWFRGSLRDLALELGIAGWARNCADGTVEAVLEGSEHVVLAALAWCRSGPPDARVATVSAAPGDPEGLSGFDVR